MALIFESIAVLIWILAIAAINSYVWYHVGKAKSDKEWESALSKVYKEWSKDK